MSIFFGIALIIGGVLLSTIVTKKMKNKNVEIQFMKTTTVGELKKTLQENAAQGLTGYREYAEIKGLATSETLHKAPYSEKEVAYYDASIYQVFEEIETYEDKDGTHERTVKRENLMSSEKSPGPIVLFDETTSDNAYLEIRSQGMQLDTLATLDKFEPTDMMQQYNFFNQFIVRPMGSLTLGFRMVEKTIPLNHPLYVLGEAYLENSRLLVTKPSDDKKPYIVSTKSEDELVQSNKSGANMAFYCGILLAIAGIALIVYAKFFAK